jgi:hypothetical protein
MPRYNRVWGVPSSYLHPFKETGLGGEVNKGCRSDVVSSDLTRVPQYRKSPKIGGLGVD